MALMPWPITSGMSAPGSAQTTPIAAAPSTVPSRARNTASRKRLAVGRTGSRSGGKGYVAESTISDGKPTSRGRRPIFRPRPLAGCLPAILPTALRRFS
jgi:hypothetical protein